MPVPKELQDSWDRYLAAKKQYHDSYEVMRKEDGYLQETIEKIIEDRWKAKFDTRYELHTIASSSGEVFTYYVKQGEEIFYFTSDGRWCDYDHRTEHATPKSGPEGLTLYDLKNFIRDVERDIPYPFKLVQYKVKGVEDITEINSFDDIRVKYADRNPLCIAEGKVWYHGWDIPDHYVIAALDGKQWAWYSTDAHGGSLCNVVQPGDKEALGKFQRFLEQERKDAPVLCHIMEHSWR